jgi:hypothetical protein
MKTITTVLLTSACALTITNNSFGMLTKTLPTKHIKKIRSFHTSPITRNVLGVIHCPCLPQDCHCGRKKLKSETDDKELRLQRVQVVRKRQQIKERNNILKKNNDILMTCITEQNKVIDQIEEWDRQSRTQFELQLAFYEMTTYAQKLLELEQQKETLLS